MVLSLDLADRVVLVTGGTKGVGLGITRVFLAAGADCGHLLAHRGRGASTARPTGSATCATPRPSRRWSRGIVADHGRLDVLVNNAGGAPYAAAADASPRFHAKIVELNLLAPLLVAQAANAVMQQQDRRRRDRQHLLVVRAAPSPGTAAYGAAKAGVDSLTRSLAVEWAPKVRVNAIDVGMVRTEQTDLHYGGDEGVARIEATIPLGRMADPADVGHVAAFLASDLAAYVSGATIECHGGGEPPVFLSAARVQPEGERPMTRLLEGRVAIVTGAGRGIGREHALELARQGAKVVVNDLGASLAGEGTSDDPAHEVVALIEELGGEAVANGADVADFAAAEAMVRQAIDTFGGLDILVNNAGFVRDRMLVNTSEEEWDAVIRVHLKGHFATAAARRCLLAEPRARRVGSARRA